MNPRALLALVVCLTGCFSPNAAQEADIAARRSRLQTAEAMFQERCKKAGVTIHRTAENVEGVLLMKLRSGKINFGEQFLLDDPYGRDLGGDGYIVSFLRGSFQANTSGTPPPGFPPRVGYLYVEAVDPKDGKRYRYTGSVKAVGRKDVTAENVRRELAADPAYDLNIYAYVLDKVPALGPAPPLRHHLRRPLDARRTRVLDRRQFAARDRPQDQEVMAERIGYMMDRAQGSGAGGRSPWLFAADHACPSFGTRHGSGRQPRQAQDFAEKVLKPKLEN
jgi:hypothetical protein